MTRTAPDRPAADEYNAYYETYVGDVSGGNILDSLESQKSDIEGLFGHMDDTAAMARYQPGKWSVKEVLGHMTDTERVFGYRMLRVARGDSTPLASFAQDDYVSAANFDGQRVDDLLDGFLSVRSSTITLANSLDAEAWLRRGTASNSPVSARALLYIIVGHAAHHMGILRERYGLQSAPLPIPPL